MSNASSSGVEAAEVHGSEAEPTDSESGATEMRVFHASSLRPLSTPVDTGSCDVRSDHPVRDRPTAATWTGPPRKGRRERAAEKGHRVTIAVPGPARAADPFELRRRHLLLIGTSEYDRADIWPALDIDSELTVWRNWLTDPALGTRRFAPLYPQLARNPTAGSLFALLSAAEIRPRDALIAVVTGHGEVIERSSSARPSGRRPQTAECNDAAHRPVDRLAGRDRCRTCADRDRHLPRRSGGRIRVADGPRAAGRLGRHRHRGANPSGSAGRRLQRRAGFCDSAGR